MGSNTNFGRDYGQQGGQGSISQGAAGSEAWKVDGSGVTQPVSGAVTVTGGATAAKQPTLIGGAEPVILNADARNAALTSGLWTLAAGVVEQVTIPAYARGFRLRPSADIRFAIAEDPVAEGTEALTVGNTAIANEWEVRLLESPVPATLRLLATGATTVKVGFF